MNNESRICRLLAIGRRFDHVPEAVIVRPAPLASPNATERYLRIAAAIKAETGVKEHLIRCSLTGRAFVKTGKIEAPEGRTRNQLYILAHECGHLACYHNDRVPRHVEELQAEKWAHSALRRHGIAVPRKMTKRARRYVFHKINQAVNRGARYVDPEAWAFALGKRFVPKRGRH